MQVNDFKLDDSEDVNVHYPCAIKSENGGFSFKVPGWPKL